MFKKALAGIVLAIFLLIPANSYASDEGLLNLASKASNERAPREFTCQDPLARILYSVGFRGHNIREAWAIAMRESNGIPSTISNSDYGLFQFNYPSWGNKLDWSRILDPYYNASAAYKLSRGGKKWTPWGMNDHNEFNFSNYGMWSEWQLYNWIVYPYRKYYAQYPCK